ncbi:MAG: hypothetical protein HY791_12045 [Deltaproteobacteria bacterium]|nr:hypothetical protein [Deltaproteobacteria bacterium]
MRTLAPALALIAACGPVSIQRQEDGLLLVLLSDRVEVISPESSVRIEPPDESDLVVVTLARRDLVSSAGEPLSAEELTRVKAGYDLEGGCGRCAIERSEPPQIVASGDLCRVPRFARLEAFDTNGNAVELSAEHHARVERLRALFPGECDCRESEPRLASGAHCCPVAPARPVLVDAIGHPSGETVLIYDSPKDGAELEWVAEDLETRRLGIQNWAGAYVIPGPAAGGASFFRVALVDRPNDDPVLDVSRLSTGGLVGQQLVGETSINPVGALFVGERLVVYGRISKSLGEVAAIVVCAQQGGDLMSCKQHFDFGCVGDDRVTAGAAVDDDQFLGLVGWSLLRVDLARDPPASTCALASGLEGVASAGSLRAVFSSGTHDYYCARVANSDGFGTVLGSTDKLIEQLDEAVECHFFLDAANGHTIAILGDRALELDGDSVVSRFDGLGAGSGRVLLPELGRPFTNVERWGQRLWAYRDRRPVARSDPDGTWRTLGPPYSPRSHLAFAVGTDGALVSFAGPALARSVAGSKCAELSLDETALSTELEGEVTALAALPGAREFVIATSTTESRRISIADLDAERTRPIWDLGPGPEIVAVLAFGSGRWVIADREGTTWEWSDGTLLDPRPSVGRLSGGSAWNGVGWLYGDRVLLRVYPVSRSTLVYEVIPLDEESVSNRLIATHQVCPARVAAMMTRFERNVGDNEPDRAIDLWATCPRGLCKVEHSRYPIDPTDEGVGVIGELGSLAFVVKGSGYVRGEERTTRSVPGALRAGGRGAMSLVGGAESQLAACWVE